MSVVAARMHRAVGFGSIFKPRCFLDFKRVHIGAEQHRSPRCASFQNGDNRRELLPVVNMEIEIT
jgi:hypothetical protein